MTKSQRNKIIAKGLRKTPVKIKKICGEHLPDFWFKFENYFEINGENIFLKNAYVVSIDDENELKNARFELYKLITDIRNKRKQFEEKNIEEKELVIELNQQYKIKLIDAYTNVLSKEMDNHIVRIPCSYTRYDENAVVQSYCNKYSICYSPIITKTSTYKTIKDVAEQLTESVIKNQKCGIATVKTKRKATEDQIEDLSKLIETVAKANNEYEIEIYKKQKDNSFYRHREDRDI